MTPPRQSPTPPADSSPPGDAPATAADLLGPQAALAAQQQGRAAALAGQPVTTCPWRTADAPRDRAARDMWIRGYAAGRTDLRLSRPPAES